MTRTEASLPTGSPAWLALVREKVESRVVRIVVHDRKVTQTERTEKDSARAGDRRR